MTKPAIDIKGAQSKIKTDAYFLPFEPFSHSVVAPINRFSHRHPASTSMDLVQQQADLAVDPSSLFKPLKTRTFTPIPIKELISLANGSADAPIDLTSETTDASLAIKQAVFKTLEFKEDIRPSYQGTWTRAVSPRTARKVSRMPTYRGLPDVDYDYDSEAEWEEPEPEDENLDDTDDESEGDDDADDMEAFLDDENDVGKRAITTGDNEPISTGLCWEGDTELVVGKVNLDEHRLQLMHDDQRLPIDPYSTVHWSNPPAVQRKRAESPALTSTMQPPRLPLSDVTNTATPFKTLMTPKNDLSKPPLAASPQTLSTPKARAMSKPAKAFKMVPDDLLAAFKLEVQGSDLNKIAIVEILKKKFPSCSKDSIKGTLDAVAVREGAKEADKRWVLR
jgi:chromatin assembly factor 1 subunit A